MEMRCEWEWREKHLMQKKVAVETPMEAILLSRGRRRRSAGGSGGGTYPLDRTEFFFFELRKLVSIRLHL
jgi:hypothetical protein